MAARSHLGLVCAAATLWGCEPWWTRSIVVNNESIIVDNPSSPSDGCPDTRSLLLTVNGVDLPPAETGVSCWPAGQPCTCNSPVWPLDRELVPERDDGLLSVVLSDQAGHARSLETEDPWFAPPALVGDAPVRRGDDREIVWSSLTPPSDRDAWRIVLTRGGQVVGGTLVNTCPDEPAVCEPERPIDRLNLRFQGQSMRFRLPESAPVGSFTLHVARSFTSTHLECDFGSCGVGFSFDESLPITIE